MSSELQEHTLGDICSSVSYGYTESASLDPIGPKFLRITDIQGGRFEWNNVPYCPAKESDIKKYALEVGDIVIARTGNSTGENAQIKIDPPPAVFASYLIRFRPDTSKANPFFVGYQLRTERFNQYVSAVKGGSAQPGANAKQLGAFPIRLIDRSSQNSVVEVLDALDNRITLLRETNKTLESIAQAIFKSWFVDFDPVHAKAKGIAPEGMDEATAALFPNSFEETELGTVPKGWKVNRLGDITDRITKGTTPTTLNKRFIESGVNFIKVESITETGELLIEKFAHIDVETHKLLKRSQLEIGDILVTIAGTIGRIAEVSKDHVPANTNQAVALIRPIYKTMPGGMIKRFLHQQESRQGMRAKVVQAVQANLSLGSLSDMPIVTPPNDVSVQLYERVLSCLDTSVKNNRQKIRSLSGLRDTLLPRLISGQLRIEEAQEIVESV